MVIGQPFLRRASTNALAPSGSAGWCFIVLSQLLGADAFGFVRVGSSVKVTAKGDGDGTGSEKLARRAGKLP